MKELFIVENHHEVLPFWAAGRRKYQKPLTVLTVDHHTDVVRAFRDGKRTACADAWQNEEQIAAAVKELKHDEHFDWALQAGIIKEAFIASHTCATPPADERLHICCDPRWPEENDLFRSPEHYRSLADGVLESDYLSAQFGDPGQYEPFILDIDCDYILTQKALAPKDESFFYDLVKRSCFVTLSLEKDWVRLLKFPGEELTAKMIQQHITAVCRSL